MPVADRPAHLLFHGAHAQPRPFGNLDIAIAIEPAGKKDIPSHGLETIERSFKPPQAIARFEMTDGVAPGDFDFVEWNMAIGVLSVSGARLIAGCIACRFGKERCRRLDLLDGTASPGEADEDLLHHVLGSIEAGAPRNPPQKRRALGPIHLIDQRRRYRVKLDKHGEWSLAHRRRRLLARSIVRVIKMPEPLTDEALRRTTGF